MKRSIPVFSKIFLILLFICVLFIQTIFLPVLASEMSISYPEVEYLRYPLLISLEISLLLVDVIIVSIFMLLEMIIKDEIFEKKSYFWVNTMIVCFLGMAIVFIGIDLYLSFILNANPPFIGLSLLVGIIVCVFLALLLSVMLELLKKASQLEHDSKLVV